MLNKCNFAKISLALLITAVFSSVAFAASKATLVLFYTNWDVASRQALSNVQQSVDATSGKVALYKINIDKPSAPEEAARYGISIPNKAPFIIIVNNDNKILYQGSYKSESSADVKKIIDLNVK